MLLAENFSDRSRKVLFLANQEAKRMNSPRVGTEDLLLGILNEGSGIAATVLKNHDLDIRKVRVVVQEIWSYPENNEVGMKLPHSDRLKSCLENAIAIATELNHKYVGTEHLLLSLVVAPLESGVMQVLKKLNVLSKSLREETFNLLGVDDKKAFTLLPDKIKTLCADVAQLRGLTHLKAWHNAKTAADIVGNSPEEMLLLMFKNSNQ